MNELTTLDDLEAEARSLETQAHTLVEKLRLARGTRDIPVTTAPATTPTTPPPAAPTPATTVTDLGERLAAALRETPRSIEDLVSLLKVPSGRITRELRPLRRRLWNAGTETAPKWFLPPTPDAPVEAFTGAVRALISLQPHSTAELITATGTQRSKKVWHALTRLNDEPKSRLVRMGDPRRPRWFWVPTEIDLSKFAARAS